MPNAPTVDRMTNAMASVHGSRGFRPKGSELDDSGWQKSLRKMPIFGFEQTNPPAEAQLIRGGRVWPSRSGVALDEMSVPGKVALEAILEV